MVTREQIVQKAREFVGTPYHHQGRLKHVGVDCVGLVVCIAEELGIAIEDQTRYPQNPDGSLLPHVRTQLEEIPVEEAKAGDIYMVYVHKFDLPQHFLLITDYGIVHAFNGGLKKVVETTIGKWKKRIVTAFKFKGVI